MQSTLEVIDEVTEDTGRAVVARNLDAPRTLIAYATKGCLSKRVMADLLTPGARQTYVDTCAAIERRYTEECTASGDPCLESGCAVEGDICLQPLLRHATEYHQACVAEWLRLFRDPWNRSAAVRP